MRCITRPLTNSLYAACRSRILSIVQFSSARFSGKYGKMSAFEAGHRPELRWASWIDSMIADRPSTELAEWERRRSPIATSQTMTRANPATIIAINLTSRRTMCSILASMPRAHVGSGLGLGREPPPKCVIALNADEDCNWGESTLVGSGTQAGRPSYKGKGPETNRLRPHTPIPFPIRPRA
jgi:hypothetical protein